jgi:hypothetical protein
VGLSALLESETLDTTKKLLVTVGMSRVDTMMDETNQLLLYHFSMRSACSLCGFVLGKKIEVM